MPILGRNIKMISIYNESRTPWEVKQLDESVMRITRTKETTSTQAGKQVSKSRKLNLIAYSRIFNKDIKLQEVLNKAVHQKDLLHIEGTDTTIVFNRKEFKPFITERAKSEKDVLLASIFLRGRRILKVRNKNTFLLEFFMLGAEFSFAASFNMPDAQFSIDLLDTRTNKVNVYTFSKKDGGALTVTITERDVTEADVQTRIRVFRPARPTHLVLVSAEDLEKAKKHVTTEQYNIVTIDPAKLAEEVKPLLAQNYKAVTLFCDTPTRVQAQRYTKSINTLKPLFDTVFALHNDGKIDKVQY